MKSAYRQKDFILCLFVCVFLVFGQAGTAQKSRPCSDTENRQAENEEPRRWDELYRVYKQYGRCNNVSAAEGFSESVARILVDHWDTLPRLARLSANHGFRRFVLGHVDATLDMEDVRRISVKATESCPQGLRPLCRDLKVQADAAIDEDASYHHKN